MYEQARAAEIRKLQLEQQREEERQRILNEARRRSGELSAFLKDCAVRTKKVTALYGFANMVTGCSGDEEYDLDVLLMKPSQFVARLH